jgi:hypothetical protein
VCLGPLPAQNERLWDILDELPPHSLIFNRALPTFSFIDEYAAVIENLSSPSGLKAAIGAAIYAEWTSHLASMHPLPPLSKQSRIFSDWADQHGHAQVARVGASAILADMLFEGQKRAIEADRGNNDRRQDRRSDTPKFSGDYKTLCGAIDSGRPMRTATFDSSAVDADVSNTWAGGQQIGLQGLWTGCKPDHPLSLAFAANRVRLSASIQSFTPWMVVPGGWYSSGLLNVAYSQAANFPQAFGPCGRLLFLISSLEIADGLHFKLTSDASFSADDRAAIQANAGRGMWPFYLPSGDRVRNTVSFDHSCGMMLETSTAPGHPFVLGGTVLGIDQYLGHSPSLES